MLFKCRLKICIVEALLTIKYIYIYIYIWYQYNKNNDLSQNVIFK